MKDESKKYLFDIKKSIESVNLHLKGIDDFNRFSQNLTVKRAVERELEIIGEAMNRLLSLETNIVISDKRKIVAMRNRIIHGYDSVDDAAVWNVIVRSLPVLKSEIEKLLE
jgi:uncharacterized protein with HEPN domain